MVSIMRVESLIDARDEKECACPALLTVDSEKKKKSYDPVAGAGAVAPVIVTVFYYRTIPRSSALQIRRVEQSVHSAAESQELEL